MKSNTQLATKQIRLQQWTAIIRDRQQSGMKVDEYCQSHGITRDMYFYWLRKVKEAALDSSGVELVELKEPEPSQPSHASFPFTTEATISAGRLIISVNRDTPKDLIISLMEAATNVK